MSFTALLWKDTRRELRGREAFQAGLVVALLFLMVDLFAFHDLATVPDAAAVVLWTPIVFGAAALCARGIPGEADLGTLDLLRTLPVPLAWHGWSRTLLNAGLLAILATLTASGAGALFAIPVSPELLAVLALGVVGLAVAGTLASGIAAQARSREMLLPLLVVPVVAPLLQAGIGATVLAVEGAAWDGLRVHLLVLAGYDILAFGTAWLLWPIVLEGD